MDWKTFTVEMVSSVVWPATVLVLALVFRGPVSRLLNKIRHIKHNNTELLLGQIMNQQEPISQNLKSGTASEESEAQEDRESFFFSLAKSAPKVAILEAWDLVQNEAEAAISRAPKEIKVYGIPDVERWIRDELLSTNDLEKYRKLKLAHSIVSHSDDLELSKFVVQPYIRNAIEVANALRRYQSEP